MSGYAWAGGGRRIVRVDLTGDGGQTWTEAHSLKWVLIKKDKMISKTAQILNRTLRQDNTRSPRHWGWTLWEGRVTVGEGGQVFKYLSPSQRNIFLTTNQLGVEQSGGQWVQCSARIFQKHLESARLGQQCLQQNDNIWLRQIYVSSADSALNNSNIWRVWSSKSGTCEAWSATLTSGWQF